MTRDWRRPLTLLAVSIVLLVVGMILRLADHDLNAPAQEPFVFSAGDTRIEGTLWLPDVPATAAVALVHGDGPQDRTSADGYAPFINVLLEAGIAVAAWDKPGIGGSEGDWLAQSMQDRQAETRAALATLSNRLNLPTGALGFSQAGWVLPGLTAQDADFLVLIGAAVSWQEQGAYFTRTRLMREGMTPQESAQTVADLASQDDAVFAPTASYDPASNLTPPRWAFIQRNRAADARAEIAEMTLPLLALWGAEDLNVDAKTDAALYRETMQNPHPATEIDILPNATHGLLRSGPYNWQLVAQWPWHAQLRFVFAGRYAYAPGALDRITTWINDRAAQTTPAAR